MVLLCYSWRFASPIRLILTVWFSSSKIITPGYRSSMCILTGEAGTVQAVRETFMRVT